MPKQINNKNISHYLLIAIAGMLCLFVPRDLFEGWLDVKTVFVSIFTFVIVLFYLFNPIGKFTITKFDLLFISFVLWHFLSFFWATNPSLIWGKAFTWLFAFCLYKIISSFDFEHNKELLWQKVFLGFMLVNYSLLLWFLIDVVWQKDSWKFSYNDLDLLSRYFSYNANYIAVSLSLLFPIYFIKWKIFGPKKIILVLAGLHVFLIFLLNCRGAIFAVVFQLLFFAGTILKNNNLKKAMKILPIIVGFGILFFFAVGDKSTFLMQYNPFKGVQSNAGDDRISLWKQTLQLSSENVFIGKGSGNWVIEYLKYGVHNFKISYDSAVYYTHPHNQYLHILSEIGFVGLLLYLLILIYLFWILYKKWEDDFVKIIFVILISYLITSALYGVVYCTKYQLVFPQLFVFALIGLLTKDEKEVYKFNQKLYVGTISVLSLVFCGFVFQQIFFKNKFKELNVLTSEKKGEEALSLLQNTYSSYFNTIQSSYALKMKEAHLLLKLKRKKSAIEAMETALEDHPYYYLHWYQLGNLYLNVKNETQAKVCFDRVYELNENYFNAQLKLAKIALNNNKIEKAKQWLSFFEQKIKPTLDKYESNENWKKRKDLQRMYKKFSRYKNEVEKMNEKIEGVEKM